MKKSESKIKISDLQKLNDAAKNIDLLERQIEALDEHLKEIAEDEDFVMRETAGLYIPVNMRSDDPKHEGRKFMETIQIPPSLIPYEKLISKHIKKLRKSLAELQGLFAKEEDLDQNP